MKKALGMALLLIGVAALSTVACLLGAFALPAEAASAAYGLGLWLVVPVFCALTAYRATRGGLSAYLAFCLPPIVETGSHWLLLGYPPANAGMALLTAGVALVAAATAATVNDRKGNKRA